MRTSTDILDPDTKFAIILVVKFDYFTPRRVVIAVDSFARSPRINVVKVVIRWFISTVAFLPRGTPHYKVLSLIDGYGYNLCINCQNALAGAVS